jgi:dCMP deaminase
MIIGITSFLAAGKDTIGKLLEEKGFERHSCSDYLREVAKEKNIEVTRDNLVKLGNELRRKYGTNILAEKLIERINNSNNNLFVIESIRTTKEIETFRSKLDDFALIFIDADPEIRYERAKERLKEKEHITSFEDFINSEKREMKNDDPFSQQLDACKEQADIIIKNNKDIDYLKKEISNTLVKLQIKFKHNLNWHRYFLNIAKDISVRSTCLSAHGGAVIVKENTIISTGYIGAPRHTKDCYQRGYCIRRKLNIPSGHRYEICASVHAEQNAIINAAREGVSTKGTTMYYYGCRTYEGINKVYNGYPCFICKKMIINAGIEKFVAQLEDGSYKVYDIKEWIKEWTEKDIVDDSVKYEANYK